MLKESDKLVVQKLEANTAENDDEVKDWASHSLCSLFVKTFCCVIWNTSMKGDWAVRGVTVDRME
jgi:hypothetical protein